MKKFLALLLWLALASPAFGTVTLIHKSASADKSGAAMTYTVTATTAGNLLVVLMNFRSNSTDTVSSITDGGDTFATANARSVAAGDGRGMEIWHCLNISAAITTLTINQSGIGTVAITAFEYHSSLGLFAFDTGGGTTEAHSDVSSHCFGATLTATGLSNVLVVYWAAVSTTYISVAAPFGNQQDDGHSNHLLDAQNQVAGNYQVDVLAGSANKLYMLSTAAYKEPSGRRRVVITE